MYIKISLILFVLGILVIFSIAIRTIQQWQWKTTVLKRIIGANNSAAGIEYAGFLLSVLMIMSSVLDGVSLHTNQVVDLIENGSITWWSFAFATILYGIVGIVALLFLGYVGVHMLLNLNVKSAIRSNNVAAAIVVAATYLSAAFIIAGVFRGDNEGGDGVASFVFLVAGLGLLILLTYLYRFITSYNDEKEIKANNAAAALSYGGIMVALGIIIGHAVEGDFIDYPTSGLLFGKALLAVLILYPVRQFLVQGILLGEGFRFYGGKLDEEISMEKNCGAGAVEAATYLAAAIIAVHFGY
jgi:uncharacterized membrane protein YjfL (UPF0719 family)